ncbi:hypothetical protein H6G80_32005 [Nostoc sp. FACHB-87]|uniref:hypothetical protein n=1 Tax=Nostocaceae TaxID=1162 RepID=UPI001689D584|nr:MULTISPECIES: hypothetical protein [Nostocaceae]MBD2458676.1 hypothetical protein [Nostoc sp. FACHB-87]MBD2479701.1 hypothetical protein [Anabaena sp. FACHB-83]
MKCCRGVICQYSLVKAKNLDWCRLGGGTEPNILKTEKHHKRSLGSKTARIRIDPDSI